MIRFFRLTTKLDLGSAYSIERGRVGWKVLHQGEELAYRRSKQEAVAFVRGLMKADRDAVEPHASEMGACKEGCGRQDCRRVRLTHWSDQVIDRWKPGMWQ